MTVHANADRGQRYFLDILAALKGPDAVVLTGFEAPESEEHPRSFSPPPLHNACLLRVVAAAHNRLHRPPRQRLSSHPAPGTLPGQSPFRRYADYGKGRATVPVGNTLRQYR